MDKHTDVSVGVKLITGLRADAATEFIVVKTYNHIWQESEHKHYGSVIIYRTNITNNHILLFKVMKCGEILWLIYEWNSWKWQ